MPRVIMITGTRKGLGLSTARHFLALGDTVIGCSRGPATLDHPRFEHFELDVVDEPAVVRMVRSTARKHGRIDVLINNAGVASMNALLLTTLASARQMVETNLLGTFLFTREAAKVMARKRSGRIVNLSSIAVPLRLEGEAVYAASKAAVETLTRIAALELARLGITVNAVAPGPVETDLTRGVPPATMQALLARQPLGRYLTAEEVVHAVESFLGPDTPAITGQVVYLDGSA